jgi:hypothetical protein
VPSEQNLTNSQRSLRSERSERSEFSDASQAMSELTNYKEAELKARIWTQFMSSVKSRGDSEEFLSVNITKDRQQSQERLEISIE